MASWGPFSLAIVQQRVWGREIPRLVSYHTTSSHSFFTWPFATLTEITDDLADLFAKIQGSDLLISCSIRIINLKLLLLVNLSTIVFMKAI